MLIELHVLRSRTGRPPFAIEAMLHIHFLQQIRSGRWALRLIWLLKQPAAASILQTQLIREFYYWLLAGWHGPAVRQLGMPGGHARRITSAVAMIRAEYMHPLRIEQLAEAVDMTASSFHQHFQAAITLSTLEFQKQLRLIKARRMMLTQSIPASKAAQAIRRESVLQFTREYALISACRQ